MIKIIFFDIDGTLRPFGAESIPPETQAAVQRAHEAGILCAVATGRHWMELRNENLIHGMRFDAFVTLDGEYCYVLPEEHLRDAVLGGQHLHRQSLYDFDLRNTEEPACYFDPMLGTVLQKIAVPRDQIEIVLRMAEEEGLAVLFEEERRIYANRVNAALLETLYELRSSAPPVLPVREAPREPVFMLIPVMSYEASLRLEKQLSGCQLIRWSDGLSFDLTCRGISKVSGMEAVLTHYGIAREECAAIGDGWNDVDMLQYAGLGIAMGNAKQECKEAADYVCPHILENGLSEAVDYILKQTREER